MNNGNQQPIGAWCNIRYPEEQETVRRYFSFGEDEGEGKPDKFGVPDIDIFFFAQEGESLIKDWANSGTRDYLIDSYELVYK